METDVEVFPDAYTNMRFYIFGQVVYILSTLIYVVVSIEYKNIFFVLFL